MLIDYLGVYYLDDKVALFCNIFQVFSVWFNLKIEHEVHSVFQVYLGSVSANKQYPSYCRFLVVCMLDKCLWQHALLLKKFPPDNNSENLL